MDPLQWMGAVRVQTADKNITSNPHHSSPSVNVCELQFIIVLIHIYIVRKILKKKLKVHKLYIVLYGLILFCNSLHTAQETDFKFQTN